MTSFIHKQINRVRAALNGIYLALWFDHAFKIHLCIGVILAIFAFFTWPLTQTEILFLMLSWILILITEIQNSALEEALNKLHPEHHVTIRRSKDMAAGAVVIAGIFTAIVVLSILSTRYFI